MLDFAVVATAYGLDFNRAGFEDVLFTPRKRHHSKSRTGIAPIALAVAGQATLSILPANYSTLILNSLHES